MTDRYCVFGNPIGHSKSPIIHAAFARQTGQDIEYTTQLAPIDDFTGAVSTFITAGGKGANVTVPFKQEAYALATRLTPRAERAGAVNTLIFGESEIVGDNTDGYGMLRDITVNLGCPVAGKNILLLGAGGATRGVIVPLLEEKPSALTVANRTLAKAEALQQQFAHLGPIAACSYDALAGQCFDMVIDGTSTSLNATMPPLPDGLFAPGSLAYTMMYGQSGSPFRTFAEAQGAERFSEGLGMLVEQAAEAFYVWRGIRPDGKPVMDWLQAKQ